MTRKKQKTRKTQKNRKKQQTLEEKIEQVKNFRPIDDTFFEVLADDIGVCQEMLRIILEDEKLIVKDVIVQSSRETCMGDLSVWMNSVSLEMGKSVTWKCSVLTRITI